MAQAPTSTLAAGENSSAEGLPSAATEASKKMENINLPASLTHPDNPPLIPDFTLKRKFEIPLRPDAHLPPKIFLPRLPPKWEPPQSKEKRVNLGLDELKRARPKISISEIPELQTQVIPSHKTDPRALEQSRQILQRKMKESCFDSATSTQIPSALTCKPPKQKRARCWPDCGASGPNTSQQGDRGGGPLSLSKTVCLTAALTSDTRVKDSGKLNNIEKLQLLEEAQTAAALVLTLVYQDGTTQLDPEQASDKLLCLKQDEEASLIQHISHFTARKTRF